MEAPTLSSSVVKSTLLCALAAATIAPATFAQSLRSHEPDLQSSGSQPELTTASKRFEVLPANRPLTPIHTQAPDMGVPYGLWCAGDRYKASFHDGMHFVPYLGRDYPIAQSFGWRTVSARVGQQELVTHAPKRATSQLRAEFALGGLVEAYDVRKEGLEQTFVLPKHPDAKGDLVIRGAVDSLMRAQPREALHAPVAFYDEQGRKLITYGAATAIDAHGARCAMTTEVTENGIVLRLAADWLASASFPVVVDPLIGPTDVQIGPVLYETEINYDGSLADDEVWLAEVRYASSSDSDMALLRVDNDGGVPYLVYVDDSNLWSVMDPSIGLNRPAGRSLTAFARDFHATGLRRVRLHVHANSDFTLSNNVLLLNNADGRNRWRPAVSNELSPISFTSLMVVYQVENSGSFVNSSSSEIQGATIALGGSGTIIDQFVIADEPLRDYERPSIAHSQVGPSREWNVAYQQISNLGLGNPVDWDIGIRRVLNDGTVATTQLINNGFTDQHQMAPLISGADDRLMLFYTESLISESSSRPSSPNGHRIRGVRLDYQGGSYVKAYGTRMLQSNADARLLLTGADYDLNTESHWAYAFRSNVTDRVYMRTVGFNGDQVSSDLVDEPSVALGDSVGGQVAFRSSYGGFIIGYGVNEPGINNDLRFARRPWSPNGSGTTGSSCSPATIDWYGTPISGTETCGVQLDNVPANSFAVIAAARATASLQLFGIGGVHDGCWLYLPLSGPDHLGLIGPQVGTSMSFPLPLPANLPAMTLYFQGIVFDGNSGEFYSTERLQVWTGN